MRNILIIFIFFTAKANGQSNDSLGASIPQQFEDCDKYFSFTQDDSSFCNYYIKDFKDTVYFMHSYCIIQAQTTSPTTFKRRILGGNANGFIRIYSKYEDYFSITDGNFSDGFISNGSYLEYNTNDRLQLTGQYENGHRTGVWTWYFENGKINRIIIFENAEPIRELAYDLDGVLTYEYDFVAEKTKSNIKE